MKWSFVGVVRRQRAERCGLRMPTVNKRFFIFSKMFKPVLVSVRPYIQCVPRREVDYLPLHLVLRLRMSVRLHGVDWDNFILLTFPKWNLEIEGKIGTWLIAFTTTIIRKITKIAHLLCHSFLCCFVSEMMTLFISYITLVNKLLMDPCGCADLYFRSYIFIYLHEQVKAPWTQQDTLAS